MREIGIPICSKFATENEQTIDCWDEKRLVVTPEWYGADVAVFATPQAN